LATPQRVEVMEADHIPALPIPINVTGPAPNPG